MVLFVGGLDYLFVFGRCEVVEEEIDGVDALAVLNHFIVEVRALRKACAAYIAQLLSPFDALPCFDRDFAEVGIEGLEAKAMIDDTDDAIAGIGGDASTGGFDDAVACGIDRSPLWSSQVNAGVHTPVVEYGVESVAKSGDESAPVFRHGHNGGH